MCWNWLAKMAKNARDFLFNSDYPLDQIVYFKEASFLDASLNLRPITIPHGLSFTPLVFGVWDNNEGLDSPTTINAEGRQLFYNSTLHDWAFANQVCVLADDTNINIYLMPEYNESTQSWKKTNFYLRLYAFEPSDSNASIPRTSNKASKFILNTSYNYLKLKEQGVIDADYATANVSHGLGYIPQVMTWFEMKDPSEQTTKTNTILDGASSFFDPDKKSLTRITTQNVYFDRYNNNPTRFHYRIYYDEA